MGHQVNMLLMISNLGLIAATATATADDDCGGVRDIDCYDFEFHGKVSNALNGKECKTWTRNGWTDNFCRNNGYHTPWCYRKSGGWDYCDVRKCEACDKEESCLPIMGIRWIGTDINPDTATKWDKRDTHEECKTLCEETSGCNFYTWKKDYGCFLKSKRSKTRSNGAQYVSGIPCKKCTSKSCKTPNIMDSNLFMGLKKQYLALDKNDEKSYEKGVKELLPQIFFGGDISSEDIGIAKAVTAQTKSRWPYPLALLEGDDVNLVRVPSKVVQINGTVNNQIGKRYYVQGTKRPTGLFAAPGEIVSVTIPEDLVSKISVRIGHLRYLVNLGPLTKAKQNIASPFGGLIVLVLDDWAATTRKGMFPVPVENAIEAPNFVFSKNTNDDWSKMKHSAAPWTVLRVPGQMAIYIETLKVKNVTNMTGVMANVKKTMDIYDELLGVPVGSQPGEETMVYDPKQNGGLTDLRLFWWHGIWTIRCWGAGDSKLDAALYKELINNNWNSPIAMHEIGHRGSYPDFPNTCDEWTAELVKQYILFKRGFSNWDDWAIPWDVLKLMVGQKIFSKGRPCYEADGADKFPKGISYKPTKYYRCWTVLFRFPLSEFGWDTLRKAFNWNADKSKYRDMILSTPKVKTDRYAELYCKATGHNLIPFFNFFNLNISASVATPCQAQPQPKKLTEYLKVANCIANKDNDCIKMPEYQEISKKFKGDCLISGVCQKDPENEYATTTYDNSIDIFPGKWTRNRKKKCLNRANFYMVRC